MMYQAGLILEGGGLRGVYTAGVLDAFIEAEVEFSSVYGVSAGSCQGCSYLAKQKGRGLRTNIDYVGDPEYFGMRSLLKTGDFFGVDMCYDKIPNVLDPFDYDAFEEYEGKFYAVVTNLETGQAEYLRVSNPRKHMWMIRASSSLPLLSRTVIVKGKPYLDGGIGDSIPVKQSVADGNSKNVVILTREEGYRKEANPMLPLIRMRYRKYPAFIETAKNRHISYNDTLDYLEAEAEKGNVFLIRPKEKVEVDRLEKDKDKLMRLYEIGYEDGKNAIQGLAAFMQE